MFPTSLMLITLLVLLLLNSAIVIEVEARGQPVRLEKIIEELAPVEGVVKIIVRLR